MTTSPATWSSRSRRRTRFEPTNPVPPVTRARLGSGAAGMEDINRADHAIHQRQSLERRLDELERPSHPIGREHRDGDPEPTLGHPAAGGLDPTAEARRRVTPLLVLPMVRGDALHELERGAVAIRLENDDLTRHPN